MVNIHYAAAVFPQNTNDSRVSVQTNTGPFLVKQKTTLLIFSNGTEQGQENRTWADGQDRLSAAYSASEHPSDKLPGAVSAEKWCFCAIFQTQFFQP